MKKLLCYLGFHKWVLKKETSAFMTNIRHYKCQHCKEKKVVYSPWGFDKEYNLK